MAQNATTVLAAKLRASKPTIAKIATFGLDIELDEASFQALQEFREAWQTVVATNEVERAAVLAQSGLAEADVEALVELLKHGSEWEVSQRYGD